MCELLLGLITTALKFITSVFDVLKRLLSINWSPNGDKINVTRPNKNDEDIYKRIWISYTETVRVILSLNDAMGDRNYTINKTRTVDAAIRYFKTLSFENVHAELENTSSHTNRADIRGVCDAVDRNLERIKMLYESPVEFSKDVLNDEAKIMLGHMNNFPNIRESVKEIVRELHNNRYPPISIPSSESKEEPCNERRL